MSRFSQRLRDNGSSSMSLKDAHGPHLKKELQPSASVTLRKAYHVHTKDAFPIRNGKLISDDACDFTILVRRVYIFSNSLNVSPYLCCSVTGNLWL